MATVTRKINISCPPTEAWEVLSAFGEISSWASNVSHSCLLSHQKVGVGASRRIQTGPSSVTEHVTKWENSKYLAYEIRGLPPVLKKITNTWTLEPSEIGVQLSLTVEILPIRRPATPIAGMASLIFGRINSGMLKDLKQYLQKIKPMQKLEDQISILEQKITKLESHNE
tara:strand:- start:267 stop:776 length:510 start_codon:yes stop_codon:yes gene_type:complete